MNQSPGRKGALMRQSIRATTRASLMKEAETMEPPQQKRKRQFDFMTSDILRSKQMHLLADQYFSSLGNTVFIVSALITLVQAGLATVAQAKNVSEEAQSKFNITIALLSAFSVFWQSFAKHWDFSGRAGLHKSASSALTKLHNVALLRAREEQAKDSCATADSGDDDSNGNNAVPLLSKNDLAGLGVVEEGVEGINTDMIPTDLVGVGVDEDGEDDTLDDLHDLHKKSSNVLATLTKQFEQATEGCTSQVPLKISAAFETLDTRIQVCKKEIGSTGHKTDPRRVKWEKVYPSLYRILTTTIISQPGWPFILPSPDKIVDKAMEKFSKLNTNLLESLLHRNRKIDNLYDGVSESTPLLEVA